jgi:hypothetical protein
MYPIWFSPQDKNGPKVVVLPSADMARQTHITPSKKYFSSVNTLRTHASTYVALSVDGNTTMSLPCFTRGFSPSFISYDLKLPVLNWILYSIEFYGLGIWIIEIVGATLEEAC